MMRNISNHTNYHHNHQSGYSILAQYESLLDKLDIISLYINLTTIPVGIIGNLISIFIFTRPALNQRTNTGFLYAILSITNLLRILLQATLKKWDKFYQFNIIIHFESEKLIEFILLQMLSWIQVLIGFDRFIVVFSPIKGVRIMSKRWVLYSIMLGLFILILCANSPFYIRYTFSFTVYNKTTERIGQMADDIALINFSIKTVMEVYLPYLITVILDIMVIVRLRKSKRNIGSNQTANNRTSRFTINTILIDLIYLIFNFPSTFVYFFYLMFNYKVTIFSLANFLLTFTSFIFILKLFCFLPFIYSCFLFLIFLTFNRNFRSEFFSISIMLKIKKCLNLVRNNDSSQHVYFS